MQLELLPIQDHPLKEVGPGQKGAQAALVNIQDGHQSSVDISVQPAGALLLACSSIMLRHTGTDPSLGTVWQAALLTPQPVLPDPRGLLDARFATLK